MVKRKSPDNVEAFVPWAGVEPARPKTLVFETNASTNSATKAFGEYSSLEVGSAKMDKDFLLNNTEVKEN